MEHSKRIQTSVLNGMEKKASKAAEMDEFRHAYAYRCDRLDSGGGRICALELQHGVALARFSWFPDKLVW